MNEEAKVAAPKKATKKKKAPAKKVKVESMAEKIQTILPVTLRIPTADMYAYIEVQFVGTPDEAYEEYRRLMTMVKGGAGLERKDFIAILDEYLTTKTITADPGIIAQMSDDQQLVIQEIKKSFARTNK